MRAQDLTRRSIAYHEELNPSVWEGDELRADVRYKLLEIAKRFIEYLEVPNFKLVDVVLRGSLANYNYTVYSDFDLHLITDFEALDCDITEQYYLAKKTLWNDEHDITIKGHEVEAYVEDKDNVSYSQGTYSVLDGRWISKPKYNPPEVDERAVSDKVRDLAAQINRAARDGDRADLIRLKEKIKAMRKSGLEQGGEFSVENLAFKVLRNKKTLDKLYRAIKRAEDAELSIDEAAYSGNLGVMELFKVFKKCSPRQKAELQLLLKKNDKEGVRQFIKKILGVELQPLEEVRMAPGELAKFAASPEAKDILVGFEFELCVDGAGMPGEMDLDFRNFDRPAYTINGIRDFFANPDSTQPNDGPTARRLANIIESDYEAWVNTKWKSFQKRIDLNEYPYDQNLKFYLVVASGVEKFDQVPEKNLDPDSDVYRRAKQMMMDEIANDFFDSGNNNLQAYLEDIEQPMMSDLYRAHKDIVKWPWMSEDYDAGIKWAAELFTRETGWPAVASMEYRGVQRDNAFSQNKWIVEPDGSIEVKDGDDAGLEFISPPMPLTQAVTAVKKMQDWAKENAYTNNSTGLHINVSVPGVTRSNVDFVKLAVFLGDKYLLELFKRSSNHYAQSALELIEKRASWLSDSVIQQLLARISQGAIKASTDQIHAAYTEKYTSINVKDGYVEFRGPGGDYLNSSLEELTNTVIRVAMAFKIATDPKAHKQEYQKKLYQLLVPATSEKNELPDLLQMYIYGNDQLRAMAKKKIRDRLMQRKKGAEQQGQQKWKILDSISGYPLVTFFAANEEEAKKKLSDFRERTGRSDPLWVKPADWSPDQ